MEPASFTELEIKCCVYKISLLDLIQILKNPTQTFTRNFFMIRFDTSLSSERVHRYGFADYNIVYVISYGCHTLGLLTY
jgi:hypothetical protein